MLRRGVVALFAVAVRRSPSVPATAVQVPCPIRPRSAPRSGRAQGRRVGAAACRQSRHGDRTTAQVFGLERQTRSSLVRVFWSGQLCEARWSGRHNNWSGRRDSNLRPSPWLAVGVRPSGVAPSVDVGFVRLFVREVLPNPFRSHTRYYEEIGRRLRTAPPAHSGRTCQPELIIPPTKSWWYYVSMNGIYQVTMGDRGRLVIPAELRAKTALTEGTPVVLIDTPGGVVLVSREQLKSLVRADLAGIDLLSELLADRRHHADTEDAA
jgi:AbrB family looped-hinge helix DNA binding protein